MNASGRRFTDDATTRMLDHWLADGPITMPDDLFDDAVRSATATPQRRWKGWILRMTGSTGIPAQVGLAVAGVAAVVAIAIGLSLASEPPPGVVPTPSVIPTAEESPDASNGVSEVRTFEDAGFSVEIQPDWIVNEVPPGLIAITSRSRAQIMITAGDPNGTLETCRVRFSPCLNLPSGSLTELEAAMRAAQSGGRELRSRPASIDGEDARELEHPGQVFPTILYWLVVHDGRPYLIQYEESIQRPAGARPPMAAALLNSWQFLDEPAADAPLVITDTDAGYELTLPPGVREGSGRAFERVFLQGEAVVLVVVVGEPDGSITICHHRSCNAIVADSLEDLRAAVHAAGANRALELRTVHRPTTLGGVPAELEFLREGGMVVPSTYRWVYAIHDGRPFAIRFNGEWGPHINGFNLPDGFRFLD
jgi:hypothetical protein